MAVKASANITISFMVDVKATYRYYKLQASTESTPSVPTTSPPSGWTSTEPSYEEGSTNTLYFVDQTVFTNDTFIYSNVSKSTSYEAAKLAYNKAINAQNTANNAAKVATNYINYTSGTGLVVGDMTTSTLGKNTLIDANGMAVRDNETELARFGANKIEFGKNNSDTTISMRNGNVVIENLDRGGLNYTRIGSYGNFDVSSIENISTDKFRRGGILTTIEANDRAEWQYFMKKTWNELRSYKWNELNTDNFASSFGTYFETRIYADNNDQETVNGFNTARIFLRTASDPSKNRVASEMGLEADKIEYKSNKSTINLNDSGIAMQTSSGINIQGSGDINLRSKTSSIVMSDTQTTISCEKDFAIDKYQNGSKVATPIKIEAKNDNTIIQNVQFHSQKTHPTALKQWMIKQYSTSTNIYTAASLKTSGLSASNSYLVADSALTYSNLGKNPTDNYTGYGYTYANFSTATALSTTFNSDDAATVYLNGTQICQNTAHKTGTAITFNFVKGWNLIEVVWHEGTGGDGYSFGITISTNSNCIQMDAYAGYNYTGSSAMTISYPDMIDVAWIGLYNTNADAINYINRKAWIGHNGTTNFNIQNEAGGNNYVNKAWTVSSDKRLKDDIKNIPDTFVDIWKEIEPKIFRWNELNYDIEQKYQFGIIAQDAVAAFDKYGLNYQDYNLVNTFELNGVEYFNVTYEHYNMLTAIALKSAMTRLNNLESRVDQLEEIIINHIL